MNPELDEKLCSKYPLIFANRDGSPRETAMCWGFECGDGWYNLIDCLCATIQSHIKNSKKQYDWAVKREDKNLPEISDQVVAFQVKEKFGGLRFYTNGTDEFTNGAITFAENMSHHICEICGNRGSMNKGPWFRTLCDKHKEDVNAE